MQDIIETLVSVGAQEELPKFKVIMGPIGSGKSRLRRSTRDGKSMSDGFVVADRGEIFRHLLTLGWSNTKETEEAADIIGQAIVVTAIRERRNILIEIIGGEQEPLEALLDRMKIIGYNVDVVYIWNSLERCIENNATRGGDNISAFFSQGETFRWFTRYFDGLLGGGAKKES